MVMMTNKINYFPYSKNNYFFLALTSIATLVLFTFFLLPVFAIETDNTDPFSDPNYEIYYLVYGHYVYHIPYKVSDSIIQKIELDCVWPNLLIYMQEAKEETLTIYIPRQMLDMKFVRDGKPSEDDIFIVLVDGLGVEYEENSTDEARILEIPLTADTNTIEVIASGVSMFPTPSLCAMADLEQPPYYSLLPPLKQLNSGIAISDLLCKKELELLFKSSDDTPVCVKPETKTKLMERGSGMFWQILVI